MFRLVYPEFVLSSNIQKGRGIVKKALTITDSYQALFMKKSSGGGMNFEERSPAKKPLGFPSHTDSV